ncbi:MAG: glycosyltransferase [Candidatus Delongbacteria bacterium]
MNPLGLLLLPLPAAYAAFVWRLGSALADPRERLEGPVTARSPGADSAPSNSPAGISVLIAARNEEAWLGATLRALRDQTLAPARWEILVVDDGSRDGTARVAEGALADLAAAGIRGRLLSAPPPGGKKRALDLAQRAACHDWVAVLDADSRPAAGWLACLVEQLRPDLGLLAGPVVFEGQGRFARRVRLEYAGVLGAGLASFALGRPLYASGANLCWRRAAFEEAGGYRGLEEIASADDTLLIQRLSRYTTWRLAALLDPRARVSSRAPATLRAFWRQRVRWTSTERHFPDKGALAAAAGLYLVFLTCALAPLAAGCGWIGGGLAGLLLALKLLPDLRLVRRAARRLGVEWRWGDFAVVWPGQLAYGLLAPWFGTLGRVRWKESA